ncbi:hypothetical protein LNQ82_07230 [Conchiformibius steedae DSM 2580]|uniref:Uncharacterized protein n=1 Tax=Conchiformibius steedae DSM 2580 TaxID=1121352 RepID=A0AAE9HVI8_9NEIS|nr:hypothetical protein [Conchiformibius steedae]QMT34215.1 hypothetical protein H3L98_04315 [Conchiformibius steedae]URD66990.1 hypothetical protein LNQ82_07230 [Conchiformibius steedae DSM 2580]
MDRKYLLRLIITFILFVSIILFVYFSIFYFHKRFSYVPEEERFIHESKLVFPNIYQEQLYLFVDITQTEDYMISLSFSEKGKPLETLNLNFICKQDAEFQIIIQKNDHISKTISPCDSDRYFNHSSAITIIHAKKNDKIAIFSRGLFIEDSSILAKLVFSLYLPGK